LDDALNGHGGLCVIFGEAGMGKTRLAEWTAERARELGARVLWGRSSETVDTPAYWPWTQLIRQTLDPLDEEQREELVGPSRSTIALMAPGDVLQSEHPEAATRVEEFEDLTGFFKRAAEREPIVLMLEDLHAADESSQLLLQYLARETRDDRIFIVATCDRSEIDVKPSQGAFLAAIAREGVSIPLHGISEEAIAQLHEILVGQKPSSATVVGLINATEGNPLFATESITMLSSTGDLYRSDHSTGFRVPRTVRDMFRRRLSGLGEETSALLAIASVIGREFDLSLLARVAGLDPDAILDLLDPAVGAGVVHEAGALGRYRFAHVLIRETIYEDLSPAKRMRAHRLVAEAVEDTFGTEKEDRFPELAHHWFKAAQAGDPMKALAYAERAAQRAAAQGAQEEAARLYQRALKVAELATESEEHIEALRIALQGARSATGSIAPPVPGLPLELRFAKEGDFWTVVYQTTTTRLKDSKGLGYLAQLLRSPGREFHVLDLVSAGQTGGPNTRAVDADDLRTEGFGDAGEVLDSAAKAAYRSRISELQEEIDEAEDFNDPGRADRAKSELEALVGQLSGAVGLGGRDRKAASVAERARVSVTKTIKDALKRISENDPALGSHLVSTIKTGTFCSYTPDPRVPVEWQA
jgi:hypothetical protein